MGSTLSSLRTQIPFKWSTTHFMEVTWPQTYLDEINHIPWNKTKNIFIFKCIIVIQYSTTRDKNNYRREPSMKHRFIDWGSSTCDHMTVEIIKWTHQFRLIEVINPWLPASFLNSENELRKFILNFWTTELRKNGKKSFFNIEDHFTDFRFKDA